MFKCEFCEEKMIITEINTAENIAWVCCPEFLKGDEEHDSYSIELTEKIVKLFIQD